MKIGIIGGGQLGLMMAESAKKYGHQINSLDPAYDCPIKKISDFHIVSEFEDDYKINELIRVSNVVTYEFENINLDNIIDVDSKIVQGLYPLQVSQKRLSEKRLATELGIRTPRFGVFNKETITEYPIIIKSNSGGYDGKNQYILKNKNDLSKITLSNNIEYVYEELIDFDYEISVILSRDEYNDLVFFPVPVNKHINGILHTSIAHDLVPIKIVEEARQYAKIIAEKLDYVGTMAVEYFVKDNLVIFNEFAPRPHNSGHFTIEACNVSQFDNHILAITGNHIITPILTSNTIMLNVLGQDSRYFEISKNLSGVETHEYGKTEFRMNRKIGHITIKTEDNFSILKKFLEE